MPTLPPCSATRLARPSSRATRTCPTQPDRDEAVRVRSRLRRVKNGSHDQIDLLVVGPTSVACRLWFDCTPQAEFLGLAVDGRNVRFAEHVFYEFADAKIAPVRSMIDAEAIRRQLQATTTRHDPTTAAPH